MGMGRHSIFLAFLAFSFGLPAGAQLLPGIGRLPKGPLEHCQGRSFALDILPISATGGPNDFRGILIQRDPDGGGLRRYSVFCRRDRDIPPQGGNPWATLRAWECSLSSPNRSGEILVVTIEKLRRPIGPSQIHAIAVVSKVPRKGLAQPIDDLVCGRTPED